MRESKRPNPARNYDIGYGRPPKAKQFKPGQSGNPKGRPRGLKNAATLAKAELGRKVPATVNGRRRVLTVAEIAYRRLADKAMAGDQKAFGFLLMLANNVEPHEISAGSSATTPEEDLAIIADYLSRNAKNGASQ